MTDTLTVATHFEDLSQFSTGLVDRVDEDRLILYGPTAYPEGERVDFAVLLLDGSPALEGKARILATVDGGEERDPSARYDIYLDGLELGGMAQAVYERILLARQSLASGEPPTGEIDVSELERMEAVAEAPAAEQAWEEPPLSAAPEVAASEPEEDFGGESTVVAADPQALAEAYEAEREPAAGGDASEPAADAGDWAAQAEPEDASDWAEPMETAQAEPENASDWAEPVDAVEAVAELQAAQAEVPSDTGEASDWAEPVEAAQAEREDASDWAEPADADYAPVDTSDLASPLEDIEANVDGPDAGTTAALAGDPSIPPPAPADPGGFQLPTVASGALTRPSREPAWWPAPGDRPEAREVSGYFAYEGELPIPSVPPRPELDPSYRVGPAPQPAAGTITEAEAESVDVDMQPAAEADEIVDLEADDATRQVEMPEAEIAGGELGAEAGEAQAALAEEAVELAEADTAFEIDEVDVDGTDAALDVAEVDIEETAQADVELDELAAIDIDEPSDELEPG